MYEHSHFWTKNDLSGRQSARFIDKSAFGVTQMSENCTGYIIHTNFTETSQFSFTESFQKATILME